MTGWCRDLVTRSLPQLHECRGVTEKLFAGRRQGRTAFIANEQRAAELLLKGAHAGADGGLPTNI